MTKLDPAKTIKWGRQTWEAGSADHRFAYIRLEIPGTPWAVYDVSDGRPASSQDTDLGWFSTLAKARAYTATI